jgi:DNA replication protein DnaC
MAEPSVELRKILRRLKLSPILETLPERATLARQQRVPHIDFLELVLADEVTRRDRASAQRRATVARLDPTMTLEAWQEHTKVRYDRDLWAELITLRFVDEQQSLLIVGPVGVGKSHLASALGHVACRRGRNVLMHRADHLFKNLRAARLDNSYDAEIRKLLRVDLLIVDDLALKQMDPVETHDFYELVVERHRRTSTIITSNRGPDEWIGVMADPLLAQSAIDRLQSTSFELVVEGKSYRQRQKPTIKRR